MPLTRPAVALVALVVVLALGVVARPHAQPFTSTACGVDTKIFGCLESPAARATVSRAHLLLQGWALSCQTAQQPAAVTAYFLGVADGDGQQPILQARPDEIALTWRGERPDVLAYYSHYCNLTSAFWGYAVTLDGTRVAEGPNILALQFVDPSVGIGVSTQQVFVTVTP